jgi:hypothetical protein
LTGPRAPPPPRAGRRRRAGAAPAPPPPPPPRPRQAPPRLPRTRHSPPRLASVLILKKSWKTIESTKNKTESSSPLTFTGGLWQFFRSNWGWGGLRASALGFYSSSIRDYMAWSLVVGRSQLPVVILVPNLAPHFCFMEPFSEGHIIERSA